MNIGFYTPRRLTAMYSLAFICLDLVCIHILSDYNNIYRNIGYVRMLWNIVNVGLVWKINTLYMLYILRFFDSIRLSWWIVSIILFSTGDSCRLRDYTLATIIIYGVVYTLLLDIANILDCWNDETEFVKIRDESRSNISFIGLMLAHFNYSFCDCDDYNRRRYRVVN